VKGHKRPDANGNLDRGKEKKREENNTKEEERERSGRDTKGGDERFLNASECHTSKRDTRVNGRREHKW